MVDFNIFNPAKSIDKYTTVTVSDGTHSFRLLLAYVGNIEKEPSNPAFVLLWPDYSTEAFGNDIDYRVTIWHWVKSEKVIDVDTLINPVNSVACVPFRFEGDEYNQIQPINWTIDPEDNKFIQPQPNKDWYYVSIKPWVINDDIKYTGEQDLDVIGRPDRNYIGSQNAFNLLNDFNISLELGLSKPENCTEYSSALPNVFGDKIRICFYRDGEEMALSTLIDEVKKMYSTRLNNDIDITATASIYITDDEHIYAKTAEDANMTIDERGRLVCNPPKGEPWRRIEYKSGRDADTGQFKKWLEETNEDVLPEWYESMRIFGWVKFYYTDEDGTPINLIGYKTNVIPVTQTMWVYWNVLYKNLRYGDFKMSNFPRTINKTIQQVTNITATTDSKAGIVQPIFVRVRDAASLVIHPAVTENICINLDAYKSAVKKFVLQIEGTSFPEIGRTAGGVIFKVIGNKLNGQLALGTYYILNEESEVVTSGRYQYEY